ncbi:hypothetical protein ABT75_10350 [Salmonella enterica subsp. enterica serovar Typhimurium]|nr:hypothetical protein ABT75_10350 [Salmonella enterica subsp. enterica serovar Typhimurium]
MLLTMEEIKAQLRLDEDFDTDDRHLQLLACAAQKRTETYLNRKLYAPDETIPDSDPDGLLLQDDIRLGTVWVAQRSLKQSRKLESSGCQQRMSFHLKMSPASRSRRRTTGRI